MSVLVIIPHYDGLDTLHRPLDAVANADVDARALIVDNETHAEAEAAIETFAETACQACGETAGFETVVQELPEEE